VSSVVGKSVCGVGGKYKEAARAERWWGRAWWWGGLGGYRGFWEGGSVRRYGGVRVGVEYGVERRSTSDDRGSDW